MVEKQASAQLAPSISVSVLDRITLAAFLAFVIVTGGASVAIRFTLVGLPPFLSGAARFACGGLFFWVGALLPSKENSY